MTAQDSRAMFEARMKQSPAYKPELMKWTDGRYDFNIMESAYHGFILGMESAQPPEAAPVQMPEPVAYVHVPSLAWGGKVRPVVSFEKYEDDHKDGVYSLRTPLYTEQQVRQLLAAHGVK